MDFDPPLFELFLKNDALHDPMITEHHVEAFGWATREEMARMHELTLKANHVLKAMFDEAGLYLVDFKLEFGRFHGEIVLAMNSVPMDAVYGIRRPARRKIKIVFDRNWVVFWTLILKSASD